MRSILVYNRTSNTPNNYRNYVFRKVMHFVPLKIIEKCLVSTYFLLFHSYLFVFLWNRITLKIAFNILKIWFHFYSCYSILVPIVNKWDMIHLIWESNLLLWKCNFVRSRAIMWTMEQVWGWCIWTAYMIAVSKILNHPLNSLILFIDKAQK